jgi:hypothetical protein
MIKVKKKSEHKFIVTVEERKSRTQHTVSLDDEYYQKLTRGRMTKEELIRDSFEFLLEREPKESILSKFNLKVISQYFPEFEEKIEESE